MASDTDSQVETPAEQQEEQQEEPDTFREEQQQQAKEQNQKAPNAVPEQRPIASQQIVDSQESDTYRELRDNDQLEEEPMDKAAHDRADSDAQRRKAEKDEVSIPLQVGQRVQIEIEDEDDKNHAFNGAYGAVIEVEYEDVEQERIAAAGNAHSKYAKISEYQVRTRGGRHALLFLEPDQLKPVSNVGYGRGVV